MHADEWRAAERAGVREVRQCEGVARAFGTMPWWPRSWARRSTWPKGSGSTIATSTSRSAVTDRPVCSCSRGQRRTARTVRPLHPHPHRLQSELDPVQPDGRLHHRCSGADREGKENTCYLCRRGGTVPRPAPGCHDDPRRDPPGGLTDWWRRVEEAAGSLTGSPT